MLWPVYLPFEGTAAEPPALGPTTEGKGDSRSAAISTVDQKNSGAATSVIVLNSLIST